jgi:hypothetical protein
MYTQVVWDHSKKEYCEHDGSEDVNHYIIE